MPENSKELIDLEAYVDECEAELDSLIEDITANKERDKFLDEYRFLVPSKDFGLAMRAYIWPRDMMATIARAGGRVRSCCELIALAACCRVGRS